MTIIVDTSVWIDFFRGQDRGKNEVLKENINNDFNIIALTDLILCEVLQGIKNPLQENKIRKMLKAIPVYSCVGVELAIQSASNYRELRKKGATVRNTIDCLIATYAISNNYFLLHNDKDFIPFEKYLGLKSVNV